MPAIATNDKASANIVVKNFFIFSYLMVFEIVIVFVLVANIHKKTTLDYKKSTNCNHLNNKAKTVRLLSLCSRTRLPLCRTMICFDKLKPMPVPFGLVV